MTAYLIRRIGISIIIIIGITLLSFIMLHVIAPSPGRAVLGDKASLAQVNAFNKAAGYDNPVIVQFWDYLTQLVQGNLGFSYKTNQTVDALIGENLYRSAYLSGMALVLSVLIAIPLGIFQAVTRNKVVDQVVTAFTFVTYSTPQNVLGLMLIGIFALHWSIFPAEASQSESLPTIILNVRAMFLPILTLTLTTVAGYSRYMRSSALDALAQDYIRLARAKGLRERSVLAKHLFRNASLAMITLIGLSIPNLLAGNLIVEDLFNYHGLGLLFINELNNLDFPTVIALTVLGGVATVFGNFVADVALSVADPRIRIA
jgi:peptide/nickel transport system permease protein